MKAALMRAYHQPLEFVERPTPEISRATDVLVRIGGAGVCATDLHAIEGLMEPRFEPGTFASWIAPPKGGIGRQRIKAARRSTPPTSIQGEATIELPLRRRSRRVQCHIPHLVHLPRANASAHYTKGKMADRSPL